MKKFTFKTIKPTGKWKSFDEDIILIKLNKKECGNIEPNYPHKIRLMVIKTDVNEDGNPNCIWKWITFKKEFNSVEECKLFLNEHFKLINTKYKLYTIDD